VEAGVGGGRGRWRPGVCIGRRTRGSTGALFSRGGHPPPVVGSVEVINQSVRAGGSTGLVGGVGCRRAGRPRGRAVDLAALWVQFGALLTDPWGTGHGPRAGGVADRQPGARRAHRRGARHRLRADAGAVAARMDGVVREKCTVGAWRSTARRRGGGRPGWTASRFLSPDRAAVRLTEMPALTGIPQHPAGLPYPRATARAWRGVQAAETVLPGLKIPSGSSARLIACIISTAASPCSARRNLALP